MLGLEIPVVLVVISSNRLQTSSQTLPLPKSTPKTLIHKFSPSHTPVGNHLNRWYFEPYYLPNCTTPHNKQETTQFLSFFISFIFTLTPTFAKASKESMVREDQLLLFLHRQHTHISKLKSWFVRKLDCLQTEPTPLPGLQCTVGFAFAV